MLININEAKYDPTTGRVNITIKNSTMNGYSNTVSQYQSPNSLGVPSNKNLANLDVQAPTQTQITGYNNSILDPNYKAPMAGETTYYSENWYFTPRNEGVELQKALTELKENMMMGQSTNKVLNDILVTLENIINYIVFDKALFNAHTHPGLGASAFPTPPNTITTPDGTNIEKDRIHINNDNNLAITDKYIPYSQW